MSKEEQYDEAIRYIRAKVDQMLQLMGTLPLRPEELDDDTLIALDPIGIIVDSIALMLEQLNETNHQLNLRQSEIRTILDTVDAAIIVYRPDWTVDECNSGAQYFIFCGKSMEEIIGSRLEQTCCCDSTMEREIWASKNKHGEVFLSDRWFSVHATSVYDRTGDMEKMVFIYSDITAQKRALEELRIYATVFDNTDEGIVVTDPDTKIIKANPALGRITGHKVSELTGQMPTLFKSGLHDEDFYRQMWESIEKEGYWHGEIFDRRKDGTLASLWQTISTVRDNEGKVSNYISIINDISSLRETQSRLDHLAHHDSLTDLPNRLLLQDRLQHAILRSSRDQNATAILFVDLDRFKTINDSLGHHIGDRLLQQVARRLASLVRGSDSVARIGGDEFVILLEEINSKDDAARLARKVIEALREPFTIEQHELHIGCSIGISVTPDDGSDAMTLLKNADIAMYRVKEAGRDGYHIYSAELSKLAEERLRIEGALRRVIQERQLYLLYQPIIDAVSDKVTAAEALVRCNCPEMGNISPASFIPVAEESKLIIPLGLQVLEMAVEQLVAWRRQGVEIDYLSVNVSGPQLYHSGFASGLIELLKENAIPGAQLQLEITENVLMEDMGRCVHQLNKLRGYGIRTAIDDFGTGYSSLAYLRSLPLDIIKVDRSFIQDIPGDKNDMAIAKAVVMLAQSLELESVAEGIETEAQREYMRALGCNRFQGYLYSEPLAVEAFDAYWQAHKR